MKNGRKVRTKSIREKLIYVMLIVIIAQSLVFVASIFTVGVFDNIKVNSLSTLSGYLQSRKSILEREMVLKWSGIDFASYEVNQIIDDAEKSYGMTFDEIADNKDIVSEILKNSIDTGISILRKNDVTGVFVVLNASLMDEENIDDDKISRAGMYLRDIEPAVVSANNADILVERGPLRLYEDYRLAADSNWAFEFEFDKEDSKKRSAFYDVPFEAALKNPSADALSYGYWNEPFYMSERDVELITYSMPLIGDNQEVRGIVGIEVSVEHLKKILPYGEISESGNGAYILSIKHKESTEASGILNGPYFRNSTTDIDSVYENISSEDKELHTIEGRDGIRFAGYATEVNIYNQNSPFYEDKWVLSAFLPESEIFNLMEDTLVAIVMSSIVSLLLSIVIVLFLSSHFVKPISVLAEKVRLINPERMVELDKLNIKEIDELSNAIEAMSNGVAEASSRMSKIIGMTDMPVGAFEIDYGSGYVFLTDSLADMLDITLDKNGDNHVPKAYWDKIMESVTRNKSNEYDDIYYLDPVSSHSEDRWVRIKTMEDNNRQLGVVIDVSQEVIKMKRLEYERDMDPLTGLLNRRAFYIKAQQALNGMKDEIGALIFWDIDNLKYVNDTYGHDMGDSYIQRAAKILSAFTESGGITARLSGDEFVVLVYGYKSKDDIRTIINQVKGIMESSSIDYPGGNMIKVRASAGISWYPEDSQYVDDLIKYADFAMYEIKHSMKGFVKEFDKSSYGRNSFLFQKKEILNEFIENSMFRFAFQPIVSTADGSVMGYEALMRPSIEELSSPHEVLMLSRSQSKLYQIELLTFTKAFEFMRENPDVIERYKIFINSIPNQLFSREDTERINAVYSNLYKYLVVEITEEDRGSDLYVNALSSNMRAMGSQIAIDDYGAGYSNELSILTVVPDYVKIDMSLIRGIDKDLNRQQLVTGMVRYASDRNIKVIAEGVETREEMEAVIHMGVDYIQGYYTGKPDYIIKDIDKSVKNEIVEIIEKKL